MAWIMVDIEADGPTPGLYSMISLGAVVVDRKLDKRFYQEIKPISDRFVPSALKACNFTREQTLQFENPLVVMKNLKKWLDTNCQNDRCRFVADNAGFDWMFVCYYFWKYLDENPFGFSCLSLTSLYKGCIQDMRKNFKHLRDTKHTHNALDDAIGNAEALIKINDMFKLRML